MKADSSTFPTYGQQTSTKKNRCFSCISWKSFYIGHMIPPLSVHDQLQLVEECGIEESSSLPTFHISKKTLLSNNNILLLPAMADATALVDVPAKSRNNGRRALKQKIPSYSPNEAIIFWLKISLWLLPFLLQWKPTTTPKRITRHFLELSFLPREGRLPGKGNITLSRKSCIKCKVADELDGRKQRVDP
ncbi:hypothetical protein F3Y22_tig00110770pilonHSYRG00002 [Hibiscus syriacus]|uniref:Uncharacterized protein n=1 Tax=Hibiscus syriacus TaxID=106335 RepID=A0A6A2ZU51_HIBSY|nr:hypothetical protein F3Y22_tig00110770pilonHSYRG00002 [Hibiscus syriacus]